MTIIVFGLPGSGKSFFASALAELMGAEYIKTDSVRAQSFNRSYSMEDKLQVYDAVLNRTIEMLQEKKNVVVDATFYKYDIRQKFNDQCKEFGDVYFIEVQADELVIRERLKTPRIDSDADFEVYKKVKTDWEPLTEDHLVLQSTNTNREEMLEKAITYLH